MEIITRIDAAKRGLKRYYTGKPCKHGHDSERWVSKECIDVIREEVKRWDDSRAAGIGIKGE